jgi:phage/plasmid primase-like uncharacterized protein
MKTLNGNKIYICLTDEAKRRLSLEKGDMAFKVDSSAEAIALAKESAIEFPNFVIYIEDSKFKARRALDATSEVNNFAHANGLMLFDLHNGVIRDFNPIKPKLPSKNKTSPFSSPKGALEGSLEGLLAPKRDNIKDIDFGPSITAFFKSIDVTTKSGPVDFIDLTLDGRSHFKVGGAYLQCNGEIPYYIGEYTKGVPVITVKAHIGSATTRGIYNGWDIVRGQQKAPMLTKKQRLENDANKRSKERKAKADKDKMAAYFKSALAKFEKLPCHDQSSAFEGSYFSKKNITGASIDGIDFHGDFRHGKDTDGYYDIIAYRNGAGEVVTLQKIYPKNLHGKDTNKKFVWGSKPSGASFHFPPKMDCEKEGRIYLCESFADALRINIECGYEVYTVGTVSNFEKVTEILREKRLAKQIVLVADNDRIRKDGTLKGIGEANNGVAKVLRVAKFYGCLYAIPEFGDAADGKDISDYFEKFGGEELAKLLEYPKSLPADAIEYTKFLNRYVDKPKFQPEPQSEPFKWIKKPIDNAKVIISIGVSKINLPTEGKAKDLGVATVNNVDNIETYINVDNIEAFIGDDIIAAHRLAQEFRCKFGANADSIKLPHKKGFNTKLFVELEYAVGDVARTAAALDCMTFKNLRLKVPYESLDSVVARVLGVFNKVKNNVSDLEDLLKQKGSGFLASIVNARRESLERAIVFCLMLLPEKLVDDIGGKNAVIKSGYGTGKTSVFAKKMVEKAKTQGRTILFLTHRKILSRDISAKLGLDLYMDYSKKPGVYEGKGLVLCVNSINNNVFSSIVSGSENPLIVIDEVDQFYDHLWQGPVTERVNVVETLRGLMSKGQVLAMSNDISNDLVLFLEDMAAKPFLRFENTSQKWKGQKMYLRYGEDVLKKELLEKIAAGKKVFVPCDSKNKVIALSKDILAKFPDKKVLTIHNDNSGERRQSQFMASPNEESKKYDVVIASPSLNSGVSFENGHFDKCFAFFPNHHMTYKETAQAVRRVRGLPGYHIVLKQRHMNLETDPEKILDQWWASHDDEMQEDCRLLREMNRFEGAEIAEQNYENAKVIFAKEGIEGLVKLYPIQWGHAKAEAARNKDLNNAANDFVAYEMAHGVEVVYPDTKNGENSSSSKEERKLGKESRLEEHQKALDKHPKNQPVSKDAYNTYKSAQKIDSIASMENKRYIDYYEAHHMACLDQRGGEVTIDLLDNAGKLSKKTRRAEPLMLRIAEILALKMNGLSDDIVIMKRHLLMLLMGALGVSIDLTKEVGKQIECSEKVITPASLKTLALYIKEHEKTFNECKFGCRVPKDIVANPMKFVGLWAGQLGLVLESEQTKRGKASRKYRLTMKSNAEIFDIWQWQRETEWSSLKKKLSSNNVNVPHTLRH